MEVGSVWLGEQGLVRSLGFVGGGGGLFGGKGWFFGKAVVCGKFGKRGGCLEVSW